MARTLDFVIQKARKKFGTSDNTLESNIVDLVKDNLREICSDFPYWWLCIEPGTVVPAAFSGYASSGDVGTKLAGRWLDQGWMITEPGVEYYPIYVANTDSVTAPTDWVQCEAAQLLHVKRYSHTGAFQSDLDVVDSNNYFSRGAMLSSVERGNPTVAYCHTINEVSYLRLNPTPNDYHIMSVSFQLATPPFYTSGADESCLALRYYPNLVQYLVMMEYAEWFHEVNMYQLYKQKLYGDTDRGVVRSDILNAGLIGKMKTDTDRRYMQQVDETGEWESSRDALGRGGYGHHRAGESYYYGPSGY